VRKTILKDILFFGIPALTVFFLGLMISARDGYDGLLRPIWSLIEHPANLHEFSAWNIAGLALFIVGLSFALVGVGTLKRFYLSTLMIREDHQLITHGVYGIVRHPIYLGVLIAVMGPPVYAPSLRGFLVMLLLIPIFLFRIKMEEDMLAEHFGDGYEAYRKATRQLIPFFY
jgi:protein-S-isoprenylcysteine O-methyltransferase Ste14